MLKKLLLEVLFGFFVCVQLCSLRTSCFAEGTQSTTIPSGTGTLSNKIGMLDKIGIGFNSQLSGYGVDSLSVRYWFSQKMATEGLLGFSLGDDTIFNIGGKFLSVLKEEQNLHLYGFGLIGFESYHIDHVETGITKSDDTSFSLGGGFGVEFFFNDFPNLGFGAEMGVGFGSPNGKNQFRTTAGWLSAVGVRYYI